jgi:hypothetical protein
MRQRVRANHVPEAAELSYPGRIEEPRFADQARGREEMSPLPTSSQILTYGKGGRSTIVEGQRPPPRPSGAVKELIDRVGRSVCGVSDAIEVLEKRRPGKLVTRRPGAREAARVGVAADRVVVHQRVRSYPIRQSIHMDSLYHSETIRLSQRVKARDDPGLVTRPTRWLRARRAPRCFSSMADVSAGPSMCRSRTRDD